MPPFDAITILRTGVGRLPLTPTRSGIGIFLPIKSLGGAGRGHFYHIVRLPVTDGESRVIFL
jgi:hypothetical protein